MAVLETTPREAETLRHHYGVDENEWIRLGPCNAGHCYRIPSHLKPALMQGGYSILRTPPFRYIEPEIEARRASPDFSDWWNGYKDEVLVERILKEIHRSFPE